MRVIECDLNGLLTKAWSSPVRVCAIVDTAAYWGQPETESSSKPKHESESVSESKSAIPVVQNSLVIEFKHSLSFTKLSSNREGIGLADAQPSPFKGALT
ncbi:hypothetical protein EGR_04503 [Echinococcus granulosus]|uniref:Uncharacterized protein n=1 Tax=Echinococcus granulosus TaxID=6210 RepID=W6UGN0_ECHGR|nr:hypothetical protein EGR_04503 [Echinococcus granulosus]EUB60670.1 hypothetical protein EGR_04503 [Echinococcus granulosus]